MRDERNELQRGAGMCGKAHPVPQAMPYFYEAYWVSDKPNHGPSGNIAIAQSHGYSSVLESQAWGYSGA